MRLQRTFAATYLAAALAGQQASALELGFEAPDALRETLMQSSLTATLPEEAQAQDILAAAQADYGRLVAQLYDEGYFAPVVRILLDNREAAGIDPIAPPATVRNVQISVDAGPRFNFGTARIAPQPQGTAQPDSFQSGAPARITALRNAVEANVEGWRALGFAKARPSAQRVTANHPEQVLNADVSIDTGPRLTFGALQLAQLSAVRAARIRAIAGLPTGAVFSPTQAKRTADRLRRTGAFASVSLSEADAPNADQSLDFIAQVTDQKPRRYGFGGEISSLEGLSLSGFWLHRNLLGGAERFRVEGEIKGIEGDSGGVDYRLTTRFNRPASWGADTDFYLLGEVERLDETAFKLDQATIEGGYTRYVSEQIEVSFGLGLRTARTTDVFGTRGYTIATLPLAAVLDYRDDELDAKRGYYADLGITPYAGLAGSSGGIYTSADLRAYTSFGAEQTVTLAFRGQIGSLAGSSTLDAPSDFLFYSGGGGTVRGQPYQSLALDAGGGNTIGGRSFLGLSGELRLKTGEKLGVVGFADAGYIGAESFPDAASGQWHSGAGLGVRYDTGFGPIRFDVATPTSGANAGKSVQFYVGIGQAF